MAVRGSSGPGSPKLGRAGFLNSCSTRNSATRGSAGAETGSTPFRHDISGAKLLAGRQPSEVSGRGCGIPSGSRMSRRTGAARMVLRTGRNRPAARQLGFVEGTCTPTGSRSGRPPGRARLHPGDMPLQVHCPWCLHEAETSRTGPLKQDPAWISGTAAISVPERCRAGNRRGAANDRAGSGTTTRSGHSPPQGRPMRRQAKAARSRDADRGSRSSAASNLI